MKPVLTQLMEAVKAEGTNTRIFRQQLGDLLNQNNHAQLLDRIARGRDYYRTFLFNLMRMLLLHIESIRRKKRVKTYITRLTELDQLLSKKLEEVDTTLLLTEGIIQGQSDLDFEKLAKHRSKHRTELMMEIHKEIKVDAVPDRKRKRGKTKKEKGKSTFDITLEMFHAGMTIEQIATERSLVVGTIEGHLAKVVEAGRLDISDLVKEEELKEIAIAAQQLPPDFISKDLYESLSGKYGYGKIRAVMNYIKPKSEKSESEDISTEGA
jgi:uncharacterized protein YpbB